MDFIDLGVPALAGAGAGDSHSMVVSMDMAGDTHFMVTMVDTTLSIIIMPIIRLPIIVEEETPII